MDTRRLIAVILFALMLTGMVYSQTGITIGGNYWHPKIGIASTNSNDEIELGSGSLYGPYVNFRFNKFTLGGSLFVGSMDVDLIDLIGYKYTYKRSDVNVQLGFNIYKGLAIFGAIKNAKTKYDDIQDEFGTNYGASQEDKITLYGGGVSLSIPLSTSPVFLYGSFALLTGEQESDWYENAKVDVGLASLSFGLGYRATPQLYLLGGYRSDALANSETDDTAETYKGLMFSLGYSIK